MLLDQQAQHPTQVPRVLEVYQEYLALLAARDLLAPGVTLGPQDFRATLELLVLLALQA